MRALVGVALVLVLVGAACSRDDPSATEGTSATTGDVREATTSTSSSAPGPGTSRGPAPTPPPAAAVAPTDRPAWEGDFPDPSIVWADGEYHAYATQGSTGLIQQLRSPDLVTWQLVRGGALADVPAWGSAFSVWAPTVAELGDRWVMWYVVHDAASGFACLSAAVADDPDGPFVDHSTEPLLCPTRLGGAIDPSPVRDDEGRWWLLWKSDGVAVDGPSSIWIQPLADDGRALAGEPVELLATDQAWERPHVEAPSMVRWGDRWLLLYSGAWWNQPSYGVGVAVCQTLTGPCTKPLDGPVLASEGDLVGPGGAEVFTTAEGEAWVAYHAWLGVAGYPSRRALWLAPLADLVPPEL